MDFLGSCQGKGRGQGQTQAWRLILPCWHHSQLGDTGGGDSWYPGPFAESFMRVGSRSLEGSDVITVLSYRGELRHRKVKSLAQGRNWNVSELGFEPGSSAPKHCPLVGQAAATPGLACGVGDVWPPPALCCCRGEGWGSRQESEVAGAAPGPL